MKNLETRLLQYFTVLTRVGNITKAANELHTTQPTLSRQLQELENEVGAQLFIRGKRSITLTDAGIIFERRAKNILDYLDQTKLDIQNETTGLTGTIRIGCVESKISEHVANWIADFQVQHPNVYFSLFSGDGNSIREQMDNGHLDVGFLLEPVESAKYDAHAIPVSETWGLVMSKDAPLAKKDFITGADLQGISLVGARRDIVKNQIATWLRVDFDSLNFKGERNLENNITPLILKHHYYDIGIDGILNFYADDRLTFVPLNPKSETRHTMIWRKNQHLSPVAEGFVNFVIEKIQKMPL